MTLFETTGLFANNDSDDELLRDISEDKLCIDLEQVAAFFPSKYDGFIKVESRSGLSYTIKEDFRDFLFKMKTQI